MEILDNCGVINNILSPSDIKKLITIFNIKPYSTDPNFSNINRGKNSDLYTKGSPVAQIILPKLIKHFGNCTVGHSTFIERSSPIVLHVDSSYFLAKAPTHIEPTGPLEEKNLAVIIPLITNKNLKTIIFDILLESFQPADSIEYYATVENNGLDANDFKHLTLEQQKYITKLPVKFNYSWQTGDIVWWDRRYIHCSPSYKDENLVKTFLAIFFV